MKHCKKNSLSLEVFVLPTCVQLFHFTTIADYRYLALFPALFV